MSHILQRSPETIPIQRPPSLSRRRQTAARALSLRETGNPCALVFWTAAIALMHKILILTLGMQDLIYINIESSNVDNPQLYQYLM